MKASRTSSARAPRSPGRGEGPPIPRSQQPRLRCAIYTRKSSEEGLDQEFNSLDAQREACAAFVTSQVGLGWKLASERYDDGGISGGTMERPALRRLLQDIADGKVDIVVVYKIDRLTRSLADFAKIVDVFDGNGVSFVSVTQQFNTTTSMGRLTLNVLLSFAQFEREVTAERIRDKIAASRKKGMWMGGTVPLGYRVHNRKLVIDEQEANFVRSLFARYLEVQSAPKLAAQVSREATVVGGVVNPDADLALATCDRYRTRPMSSGMLYQLLANPLYIGKVRHKGEVYDGEHDAIVDADLFDAVQRQLAEGAPVPKGTGMHRDTHLLTGFLYDDIGDRMAPTHGKANGRRYRYYVSGRVRRSADAVPDSWRIPAPEIEKVVRHQAVQILKDRSLIAGWIEHHASAALVPAGMERTDELIRTLSDDKRPDRVRSALQLVFRSINLSASTISFEVKVSELVHWLSASCDTLIGDTDRREGIPETFTFTVPIALRRRGQGVRIVLASPYARQEPDPSLVDLIARAHVYFDKLSGPSAMNTGDIASAFNVDRADVGRVLPLALLSPAMLDAMLTGRQAASLSARQLARLELPTVWAEQELLLSQ